MKQPSIDRRAVVSGLVGALLCAACAWPQLAMSWRKWADVQVDFGRELYTPWRLAEGDALYRDVAYFNGPLSPTVNAWAFRLFGTGYSTLVALNLLVLALACVLLWRLFRRTGAAGTAILAPLTLVAVFAFQHVNVYGNYNWVSPYSHELTHGVTLSLALLLAAGSRRAVDSGRPWVVAGVLLGLVFLTKVEVFLAAAAGVFTLACLRPGPRQAAPRQAAPRQAGPRGRLASIGRLAAGAAAPILLAWIASAVSIGAGPALRGVLGSWPDVFSGEVSQLRFYSYGMGLEELGANLAAILKWSAILLVLLAPLVLVERQVASVALRTLAGGAAGLVYLLWGLLADPNWDLAARPLPLWVLLALVWSLWWWKTSRDEELRERLAVRAGVLAFALVLMVKILFNARVHHYGFALAMPAAACVVVCLAGWLPSALAGSRRRSWGFGLAVAGMLAGLAIDLFLLSAHQYRNKTWPVSQGRDLIYADELRGRLFQRTLAELEKRFPEDATMVVLPEGVTLSYWSRRPNPAPYVNFMPPELVLYGEDAMVAALERTPPEIVVLTHKDTSEYGLPLFGTDYGQKLYRWVRDHYESELVLGHPPLRRPDQQGVEILRRR